MTETARILEEAQAWVLEVSDEEAPANTRARFETWLAADPRHARAYDEASRVFAAIGDLDHLRPLATPSPETRAARRRAGWSAPAGIAGLAAAAALVVFVAVAMRPSAHDPNHYLTATGEVSEVTLADGSQVTLGAASEIRVAFSEATRDVTLVAGEAFFDVSKDATRPFIVAAGDRVVRVVGTKFNVRRGAESVSVDVLEGVVEVTASPFAKASSFAKATEDRSEERSEEPVAVEPPAPVQPEQEKVVLTAGQQVIAARDAAPSVREVAPEDTGAWRSGRLSYNQARLAEVVADLNRYYDGRILFAAPDLQDITVTVSFRTDRLDQAFSVLDQALPIDFDASEPRRMIVRPAAG